MQKLIKSGILVFSLCFASITWTSEPVKLLVFGDSLVAGYGLEKADGFTSQLQDSLDTLDKQVQVINAGVSGDTTNGGLERLDWALFDQPDAIILELGANDALRGLPLDDTESNLRAILTSLQTAEIPVLLAGMKASPSLGKTYQTKFDQIFPKLAAEFDVLFYPFFLEGVAGDLNLNQADGIHPNPKGVSFIVEAMLPSVTSLIEATD